MVRPRGRLVAATNASDHLREMLDVAGVSDWDFSFRAENGAELLGRHFHSMEMRDGSGTVTLRDSDQIRAYLRSSIRLHEWADGVPELEEPLVVRRRPAVFVAEKL